VDELRIQSPSLIDFDYDWTAVLEQRSPVGQAENIFLNLLADLIAAFEKAFHDIQIIALNESAKKSPALSNFSPRGKEVRGKIGKISIYYFQKK
jgi:hypothetical protein